MRSANRTADIRCETMMIVRPAARDLNVAMMAAPVSKSTWLIGSSRISTECCFSRQRASAMRCFWPPDKITPFSPTTVSKPSLNPSTVGSSEAALAVVDGNGRTRLGDIEAEAAHGDGLNGAKAVIVCPGRWVFVGADSRTNGVCLAQERTASNNTLIPNRWPTRIVNRRRSIESPSIPVRTPLLNIATSIGDTETVG